MADLGTDVERSVRLRWQDGEFRLRITVPGEAAGPPDDLSPFLAAALLPAMRRREDLEIDGPVSPRLLRRSDLIQSAYQAWDPSLRRCRIRAAATVIPRAGDGKIACFFSRGVDSTFSATIPRDKPGPLTHLVYCDRLLPVQDAHVRTEEVRRAREMAALIGLPLLVATTNIRDLTDAFISWEDAHGPALASIALLLGGRMRHVVVPSWGDYAELGACGTSPLLDHLWSTETVAIEHDSTAEGRVGKVAWLARERPELLRHLKVCLRENRPDNCGRCRKCLWTMACLHAVGALEQAEGFPPEVDPQLIRELRPYDLQQRLYWAELSRALGESGRDSEIRRAILHALRRSARPSTWERLRRFARRLRGRPEPSDPFSGPFPPAFSDHETRAALWLLRKGRPCP